MLNPELLGGFLVVTAGPVMTLVGAANIVLAGIGAAIQKNLNYNITKVINQIFEREKIQSV
ncbi:hypothetical protein [Amphibacillus jilinensis]|uniref:hypothetical protein n=1 Tax=Amphibacillus jilinensis TaxID=1216008 RepID=UPI000302D362|nr:hypothetical protein [Amphibacillus jilinensis]